MGGRRPTEGRRAPRRRSPARDQDERKHGRAHRGDDRPGARCGIRAALPLLRLGPRPSRSRLVPVALLGKAAALWQAANFG
jgi:hypothetical protein